MESIPYYRMMSYILNFKSLSSHDNLDIDEYDSQLSNADGKICVFNIVVILQLKQCRMLHFYCLIFNSFGFVNNNYEVICVHLSYFSPDWFD
jgi:hypothetical protein